MQYWMERGAPARKLLLGFPTHARAFTLSGAETDLGAAVKGPGNPGPFIQQMGVWSYYEVQKHLHVFSFEYLVYIYRLLPPIQIM